MVMRQWFLIFFMIFSLENHWVLIMLRGKFNMKISCEGFNLNNFGQVCAKLGRDVPLISFCLPILCKWSCFSDFLIFYNGPWCCTCKSSSIEVRLTQTYSVHGCPWSYPKFAEPQVWWISLSAEPWFLTKFSVWVSVCLCMHLYKYHACQWNCNEDSHFLLPLRNPHPLH